ncbi:MAG: hypothetical protein JW829_07060 [Pirellulales bacterium]|nr:hypothetical protein [Pirellulales bacterium]
MTRAWFGTALLAGSWLIGVDYFSPARPLLWCGILIAAVLLVSPISVRWPSPRQLALALGLTIPAIWLFVFPYRVIPILFAVGCFLQIIPMPHRWPRKLGSGAMVAAAILFAQAIALLAYESLTARAHELPQPFPHCIRMILDLIGSDAAATGSTIGLRPVAELLRFSGTWELLFNPATVCFVVGGIVLLALVHFGSPSACQARDSKGLTNMPAPRAHVTDEASRTDKRLPAWRRDVLVLLIITAIWIPIRLALLFSFVMQQAYRADVVNAPNIADILVISWVHVGLVAILAWFVSRWIAMPEGREDVSDPDPASVGILKRAKKRSAIFPIVVVVGTAILGTLVLWSPVGARKSGRIMVVERHSTWEPTTVPYGTTVYGEAGSYNYAAAYAFCDQYYEMSRLLESESIDDRTLERCDVLVIKTPTARYSLNEVDAVVRFVKRGGSLLLIGDHTNVFNMNTYLNDISRHFGFTFRNDLLFRIGDPYKQKFDPPRIAHPILQHVPPMCFAVSCSIDPGHSRGTMVIRNTGLWSLPPAYHESNYHPQAEFRTPMQYGAWCQLWATSYGPGRVLGFADSTIFSNFCTFQPGKAELLIGMLEWLNHTSPFDPFGWKSALVILCALIGGFLIGLGWYLGWRHGIGWPVFVGALLCGGSIVLLAVNKIHRDAMPIPHKSDPIPHVVIDRTWSEVPLFTGAFADDEESVGYGMLEQWIPRIGNYISRRTGDDAFQGNGLVIICPTCSVGRQRLERLVDFVDKGGQVLVIDSPDVEGSTANSILGPFGLASIRNTLENPKGKLSMRILPSGQIAGRESGTSDATSSLPDPSAEQLSANGLSSLPELPLQRSCEITGGEPLATWENIPVAARAQRGKGTVVAIGFGSLFCDEAMGTHWLPEPEPEILERYEVLYAILRASLPATD